MGFKRFLIGFVVLVFVVGTVTVGFAEEAKKYPPYPDVWGYDLSLVTQDHVSLYKMSNGDYAFAYKNESNKYVVKFFFAGNEIYLTKDEHKKFSKQNKRAWSKKIALKNGDIIQLSQYKECENYFTDNYFYKINKKAQVVSKKMVFYLHNKPVFKGTEPKKITFEDLYDLRKCAVGGDIEMSMVLENAGGSFIDLDDGGFLLRGFLLLSDGFIIRFDKDLKTKSDLINKKVFLIDRDVFVKKFLKKHISEGRNRAEDYQALHDDLLKYFMEVKNKEQK